MLYFLFFFILPLSPYPLGPDFCGISVEVKLDLQIQLMAKLNDHDYLAIVKHYIFDNFWNILSWMTLW